MTLGEFNSPHIIQRHLDDYVSAVLIEANGVLPHDYNRAFVIGSWALHDVVTQSGVAEYPFEGAIGIAKPISREK